MSTQQMLLKDKLCDICGDTGVVEAIVTCPQCKLSCEHLYCMRKVCTVVPNDWCCDICGSTNMVSSDCGLEKKSSEAITFNISNKEPRYPKESASQKTFSKGARSNWHEKAVGKGKTKYLSTDEVKNMPSGDKKGEPKSVGLVSSMPSKSIASDHDMAQRKPKSIVPPYSSNMVKRNPRFGPSKNSEQLHLTRSGNTQKNTSVQKVKEMKAILTPIKEHGQMRQIKSVEDIETSHAKKQKRMGETSRASQISKQSKTCDIPQIDATISPASAPFAEDIERTNSKLQKTINKQSCADLLSFSCQPPILSVEDFLIKAAAEETLPTDPAPIASWIGSFILKDDKTSISFRAHPTSQGLSKVKEFSEKMPKVLEFELFSYKDFLRTAFKGCDPDEEDIGLYFFPDNMERSKSYISHIEQLSRRFFMRSFIDGVELLVFTSKVLHKAYRERNKSDFLWGIYRHRHGKLKGAVEGSMEVDMDIDTEDVGMDINMIGGVVTFSKQSLERTYGISGTEATAVTLPTSNSNLNSVPSEIDIPPGFSVSMRGQWNDFPPGFEASSRGKWNDISPGFSAPSKIKEEI